MEYSKLVEVYERISSTTKRLEKTFHISELLKKTPVEDLDVIVLLLQGKIFPAWAEKKLGISAKLILKVISKATGASVFDVENEWKKTGDLGIVAFNLIGKKSQQTLFSSKLSVKKVFENIKKLPELTGTGAVDKKTSLVAQLMTSAKPIEAKYIVRTVLEELRVGVGEGSLRDALVWAYFGESLGVRYDREANDIMLDAEKRRKYNEVVDVLQHAFDVTNDFSSVAKAAKKSGLKGLKEIKLAPGKPIKVMLCQKVEDVEEGFERVGKPARIEYKYDGFRMQIHKVNGKIVIYTRRLENITNQFPEVVDVIDKNIRGKEFIIDGEAVGYEPKSGRYLPFQNVSQRIKRKYGIDEMAKQFPVEINLFDVLYHDGKSLVKESLDKRREILEKITKQSSKKLVIAKVDYTDDVKEAEKFYKEALKAGNEGIIMKRHDSVYRPGSRVGGWVKIKPVMESLDVVITGAEWGHGKRSGWLTSLTVSIIGDNGEMLEIGKVGTGIKELEESATGGGITFESLTNMLKPLIISEKGKEVAVKPEIVIEVNYEEIQKSPTYASGFALRFPRFICLRDDKGKEDASTLNIVKEFFSKQRK
ncbi:ATP-dependent DNA ligase [Candidatus Woesearchaeota archaeon]|nr:ATP-dependent DNA ligase [Candidatus Woesearchaeota archaeon]